MKLSICIPVYYGAETIGRLVAHVEKELQESGYDLEFVLVNDGSKDATDQVCTNLADERPNLTYVCLRRNFGEHNAVMCALNHCTGDFAVIIDDDFQNPPSEIIKLVREAEKGFDVVYSKYEVKKHHPFRNLGSAFNDRFATWLIRKPADLYLSSFKLIRREVINEIVKYVGPFPYIDGLIFRVTDNISAVIVQHDAREAGKSTYTIGKLVALWMNMFINFSIRPLRVICLLGLVTAGFSLILTIFFIVEKMQNPDLPLGWVSTVTLVLGLGGIQTFSLGVIGEYIGKNYLDRNGTPQWIAKKVKRATVK
jgi:undecaprenyl-phosphate 4-deoxy-4-formamido-L-arabinose transferase